MNLLFSAGLEIFAVQVLGPSEIDPEVTRIAAAIGAVSRVVDIVSIRRNIVPVVATTRERQQRHEHKYFAV